jgi:hypothetical protein
MEKEITKYRSERIKKQKQGTNKEETGNKGGVKDETVSYAHSECHTGTSGSLQLSV